MYAIRSYYALDRVEGKPESKSRQETLAEELEDSGAAQDSEFLKHAEEFLSLLKKHGLLEGSSYQANLQGDGSIAQGRNNFV